MQFVFDVCKDKDHRNSLKLNCRSPAFTLNKAFSKNKQGSGTRLTTSFSARFLKKNISLVIFYRLTKIHGIV